MAVDMIVEKMKQGGRLFYIGSGTGGKLGVLDATECPPTFGSADDNTVLWVISGGEEAVYGWREDTEDDETLAVRDLAKKI